MNTALEPRKKYTRAVARSALSTSLIIPECHCNVYSCSGLTETW